MNTLLCKEVSSQTLQSRVSSSASCSQTVHCAPMYFIMLNVPVILLLQLVPGSTGKDGLCHCVVHLANYLIPLKKLEQLQSTAQELMDKYDQELLRVSAGATG